MFYPPLGLQSTFSFSEKKFWSKGGDDGTRTHDPLLAKQVL